MQVTELSVPLEVFSNWSTEGDSSIYLLTHSKDLIALNAIKFLRRLLQGF